MSRIVVVANPDKAEALHLAEEVEQEFSARGDQVFVSTAFGADLSGFKADLAAVFGGDGTVLGAVAGLGHKPPPIIAFNLGRLGYLASNPPHGAAAAIDEALAGNLHTSTRMMVEASIKSYRREWRRSALNEFVLFSRTGGRLLPVSVWVDGEELMDIRGDGVIVSTPTGSTAYALSVGGPVTSPELSAIILAPLCPHQLANRSLVLGPTETVRMQHFSERPVELMADGRSCLELEKGETLEVRASATKVRLLSPAQGKYRLLREKLGWGWKAGDHADSVRRYI